MKDLLELAKAKREAARIFLNVGREMLRGADQERLIRQSDDLRRSAADLELRAASLPDGTQAGRPVSQAPGSSALG